MQSIRDQLVTLSWSGCFASLHFSVHITLTGRHLPGLLNDSADTLSHNKLPTLLSFNSQASTVVRVIPGSLRDLVFNATRTPPRGWSLQFANTLETAWRLPHAQPTLQQSTATQPSAPNTAYIQPFLSPNTHLADSPPS